MNRHLVVMVKAPRIGQVKTRLGREIGYLKAWSAYRRMLGDILRLFNVLLNSLILFTFLYTINQKERQKSAFTKEIIKTMELQMA